MSNYLTRCGQGCGGPLPQVVVGVGCAKQVRCVGFIILC